jgi:hypothetical protein
METVEAQERKIIVDVSKGQDTGGGAASFAWSYHTPCPIPVALATPVDERISGSAIVSLVINK